MMLKLRDGRLPATLLVMIVVTLLPACQQDNNAEFLKTAPPGVNENPNESVAERKSRLRRPSPLDKKLETKRAAAAKAAARKAGAAGKTPE